MHIVIELDNNTIKSIRRYAESAVRKMHLTYDAVDDLYQEGLIEAWKSLSTFDPRRSSDPQKFARTRASYLIRELAAKEYRHRKKFRTSRF